MLLIVAIPFFLLELYLSLYVGERIGFFWSVVWIVLSMMIGMELLRRSPFTMMGNLQAVRSGKLSLRGFESASTAYFIGAILLIIPGVLSDILGILTLFYTLYLQLMVKITPENPNFKTKQGDDNVIDVEIIDQHTDRIDRS